MTATLIRTDIVENIESLLKKILIILDIEGPQVLNDNAQELMVFLAKMFRDWDKILPHIVITALDEKEEEMAVGEIIGARFFRAISNIDDIWGDFHRIPKDPTYSSGHTLKVILAFLKALNANYQSMYKFSRESLRLIPNAKSVIPRLDEKYIVWMVSTSYEFFIRAYCDFIGFPFKKVYCTKVDRDKFDSIVIAQDEKIELLEFMKEVAVIPVIKYDKKTGEVIPKHQKYYDRITSFIWNYVYNISAGELLRIVHPVGQTQKREAAEKILSDTTISLSKTMGIGDSQTDYQIAQLLRGRGLMMVFNGKGKVCSQSDIMYIGDNAEVIEEVADLFAEGGREAVLKKYTLPEPIRDEKGLLKGLGYAAKSGGLLVVPTEENIETLEKMSVQKRKEFRGVVGGLT